jgi:DNA repair photolyase
LKYYQNPLCLTCQFYHCCVPFRLDTYRGCHYSCVYCFAVDRNLNANVKTIQPAEYLMMKKFLAKAFEKKDESNNAVIQCLRRRIPLHFGGMSDPLQPIEKELKVSLKMLALLDKYDYPTVISTKSALLIEENYLRILENMNSIAVQVTLITSDERIARKLEPRAPSVARRLEVFAKLSDLGIWTACRLQPLIPKINNEDFELIERLADVGCKHVMIEHYKIPTYSRRDRRKLMCNACSYDIEMYYRKACPRPLGMFFEIPATEKIRNLRNLVRRIHRKKMTYGAADNDLHDLGDDFCCCGISKIDGFQKVYAHQNTKAVFDGKRHGQVLYSSIEPEWYPEGSVREIVNKKSRLNYCGNKLASSMKDFVKIKWNLPYTNNSPTDMANVVPSDALDDFGNIIYKYTNRFTIGV